jgi:hypothetical protein
LYYEIWETNHTCNHSTHTWVLVWQRSETNKSFGL